MRGLQTGGIAPVIISLGIILAAFCPLAGSDALAESSTGSTKTTPAGLTKLNQEVARYVAAGYSVVGPSQISSVKQNVVNLVAAVRDYPIDLANKQVKVKELSDDTLSVASLQAGAMVYVYRKGNDVMFRVISTPGGSNVR